MTDDDRNDAKAPPAEATAYEPPRWWRTLGEYHDPITARAAWADEFPEELPIEDAVRGRPATEGSGSGGASTGSSSRRDFFKLMGLSTTAAIAACSRAPEQKLLPYTTKPDEIIPGLSMWYAAACGGCAAGCGLLVKTRDGRPIKIEGNPQHPVSGGAVCAVGQASLLGLYDADRARGPRVAGKPATWAEVDAAVANGLGRAVREGKGIRLVLPWGLGPTAAAAVDRLAAKHAGTRVVRFDPLGQRDAIAAAYGVLTGVRRVPEWRLDAAHVVLGVEADFLGTFPAPATLTRQWAAGREPRRQPPRDTMLRHLQIESALSLTAGAADERLALPPFATTSALLRLVEALEPSGTAAARPLIAPLRDALGAGLPALDPSAESRVDGFARELAAAGANGLVACGSDDPVNQLLAALANTLLGNTGTTVDVAGGAAQAAEELSFADFVTELAGDAVGAVLFLGTNPALVERRVGAALARVPFSLSTAERLDETATLCTVHAPRGHYLEAWTDHRPRPGVETMGQPTVAALFDTRAETASLLAWAGEPADDYAFLRARWQREVLPAQDDATWDGVVRDGFVVRPIEAPANRGEQAARPDAIAAFARAALAGRGGVAGGAPARPGEGALQLVLTASVALHDGTGATANNGWLQELPDPMTKLTWGNVAALAPSRAQALGLSDGDVVELTTAGGSIRLPVMAQPGLPDQVVAVAVGHGRAAAGRNAAGHGADAFPLAEATATGGLRRAGIAVTLRPTGERRDLALTQTHASQEGRELVRQQTLAATRAPHGAEPEAGAHHAPGHQKGHARGNVHLGLWPGHQYDGHRWGLSIDLNKCTGCAACVVSCNAENNIPVVGEVEVRRRREMHWMRLDRYYGGTPEAPEVLHQPMLCQHCENAPCETVCPVLATVHSTEGLNQQIYNRCVGTRYCANNCPTKVRRFNWFDYDRGGDVARLVLNPDVVVRSRGVMEKCSMCVQRIEEARALSRRQGRTLADGDIVTACQQSCPAGAIVFGDANDKGSALSQVRRDPRTYTILEDINVKPQVSYMTRIKNRPAGAAGGELPGATGNEPGGGHHG